MDEDRCRWDERHAGRALATAAAPDIVVAHPDLLGAVPVRGTALDLACGAGAQSLWLAERGLTVHALDVSPVAIGLVEDAAVAAGLDSMITAVVHDTDEPLPTDLAGLDVIVCQRYRAVGLYGELVERLAAGGVLLLTVLSRVGLDGEPGEFHAPADELAQAFDPATGRIEVLHHDEGAGLASIALRRVS